MTVNSTSFSEPHEGLYNVINGGGIAGIGLAVTSVMFFINKAFRVYKDAKEYSSMVGRLMGIGKEGGKDADEDEDEEARLGLDKKSKGKSQD
jgi:hypothetical protein